MNNHELLRQISIHSMILVKYVRILAIDMEL